MKAELYNTKGEKKGEVTLPAMFDTKIREDIVLKAFLAIRFMAMQPYSHAPEAGKRHSASGTISHRRHEWKGHYGKGIARVPRKAMYRTGTQFYWVGAEVTSTRGGRRVHGPVLNKRPKKINKQEYVYALNSALSSTFNSELTSKRYTSLERPMKSIVLETNDRIKMKDLLVLIEKLFGYSLLKSKTVRPGKGKLRGRKYKSSAGLLFIKSDDEKIKATGLDVKSVSEISLMDLYPLGRLTIYTEKALKQMDNLGKEVKKEIKKGNKPMEAKVK